MISGKNALLDCLDDSLEICFHFSTPFSDLSSHFTMQRFACQGIISSTPTSVKDSIAKSDLSPFANAWATETVGFFFAFVFLPITFTVT